MRESVRLGELVRTVPVVTVTGAGGVGKTSLAARVVDELAPDVSDGVRWCDLAGTEPGPSVALAIADALGGRGMPSEDIADDLPGLVAGRELLVVLDNCEHVAADVAAVVTRIAVGDVRVLVTSRESLGLPAEHVFALEPLGLPTDDSLAAVRAADAARLFGERAGAVRTGFALHEGNAADVARLCRRLDGLPLALELAAAWARSLSPREIADRLDERLLLLARRKSHAAHRHQSLRATVDSSYELLTVPERTLFERLGVFSSAVTAGEVEAICSGDPITEDHALDLLDQLVDRSMITVRERRATTRYGMLETLRAYARTRLAERGGLEPLRDRHADQYTAVADGLRLETLVDGRRAASLDFSQTDEHLAAIRWCLDHDAGPERALRLLAPLWVIVHSHAAAEVTSLAERALERSDSGEPLAIAARGVAATGHFVLGRPERARARAYEALAAESDAIPALIGRRALAFVQFTDPDAEDTDRRFSELADLAEQQSALWVALEATALRALVLASLGEPDRAAALAAHARTRAERWGAPQLVSWITVVLGMVQLGWQSADQARASFELGLDLARGLDSPLLVPLAVGHGLRHLGVVNALSGDHPTAAELLRQALRHFRARGDRAQEWEVLRSVAVAAAAAGRRDVAERLLDGADAAAGARPLAPLERTLLERVLPARASGAPESLEALTQLALDTLATWHDAAPVAPASASAPQAAGVFRRDGPLWELAFAGTSVRMPALKGLSDVATLLAHPGREIHCLELAADGHTPRSDALQAATDGPQGDLGELVDAHARDAYRARAEELTSEIDDAKRAHDPVRAERAQAELAAIADQLQAAYGLDGRARRTGDPAERARTAVTARIRSAVRKLDQQHPPLARHLRNAVSTGTWCAYRPESTVRWDL
jgi:predicted ATPase